MILVVVRDPQPLVTVYEIVTVPGVTPVTRPVADTVAFPLLALQVPPLAASVSDILVPVITVDGPVIVPAEEPVTVTLAVAVAVPQLFVTV